MGRLLDAARRQHGRIPPRRGLPYAEPGIIHVGHCLIRRVVALPLCALADDLLDQLRLMRLHLGLAAIVVTRYRSLVPSPRCLLLVSGN